MNSSYSFLGPRPSSSKLKDMFTQVSVNIRQLLDNLTLIYQSHGVDYCVNSYFYAVMRLLSPIELLSQSNQAAKDLNPTRKNIKSFDQSNYYSFPRAGKKPSINNSQASFQQDQAAESNPNLNSNEECENGELFHPETQPKKQNSFNHSRTSLNAEEEEKICSWMKEQVSYGNLVTKADIMRQAKMLSRHKNFLASSGWFRRFLNRNEDARALLDTNKLYPELQFKKIENNVYLRKKKSQNLQLKKINLAPEVEAQESIQWQAIVSDEDTKSRRKEFSQKDELYLEESDESCESPKFSRVVNRLEGAVKGHKQSMLYLSKRDQNPAE